MTKKPFFVLFLLCAFVLMVSCTAEASPGLEATITVEVGEATQAEEQADVELPPLPDLDQEPLSWFAPLPPMPIGGGRAATLAQMISCTFLRRMQPGKVLQVKFRCLSCMANG